MISNLSYLLGEIKEDLIRQESLIDLLNGSFEKYAENTAFIFQDQKLTYQEVDLYSDAICLILQQQGVKPGDMIGIWYPRSIETPLYIIGILKSGATYLPFDIDMPEEIGRAHV